jgi:hypothetical protein
LLLGSHGVKKLGVACLASALGLVPAGGAQALAMHFEAWPAPAGETCSAPCYQVRMFLQVHPWEAALDIQSLQMDVGVYNGADPAQLFTPPDENNGNSGPGNILVRYPTGVGSQIRSGPLPWNLSSTVARSPTVGRDALMVHAADQPFTLASLSARLLSPETLCFDPDSAACDFVLEAIAQGRIYLGFFNVTRTDAAHLYADCHYWSCDAPPGTRYFDLMVSGITGDGELAEMLAGFSGVHGSVPFLPEPSAAVLLGMALLLVAAHRSRVSGLARALSLLSATSASASLQPHEVDPGLHFEAWPTSASETCSAPCYQLRMFLRDRYSRFEWDIQSLQMDVRLDEGALPAEYFTPPDENNGNSGPGNILVRYPTGVGTQIRSGPLPWNLSSTVARSPAAGFDVRIVHASERLFTLASLSARLLSPETSCFDPDSSACDFVSQALAEGSIYLGFFNVTLTDPFLYADPFDPYGTPMPYLRVSAGNITGDGSVLASLTSIYASGFPIYVPVLPEPPVGALLAAALGVVGLSRRRGC